MYGSFCNIVAVFHFGVRIFRSVFHHICAFGFIFMYGSFCNICAVFHFGVQIFGLNFITFVPLVSFWGSDFFV